MCVRVIPKKARALPSTAGDMDFILELLARVDVNELTERVDVNALVDRTELKTVLAKSSTTVFTEGIDLVRSQAVISSAFAV